MISDQEMSQSGEKKFSNKNHYLEYLMTFFVIKLKYAMQCSIKLSTTFVKRCETDDW